MSPTPEAPAISALPIAVTVADPVLATINNVCTAVAAICAFASTPGGQQIIELALSDTAAINSGLAKIGGFFAGFEWPWIPKPTLIGK